MMNEQIPSITSNEETTMIPQPLIEETKRQIDSTYSETHDTIHIQKSIKTGMSSDQNILLESLKTTPIVFH